MRFRAAYFIFVFHLSCTSSLDGPSPEITGVEPDIICTAQTDQLITIRGSGFSPAVVGGLTDDPVVQMPRVFLATGGSEVEIPAINVSLPAGDTSGTALEVLVPTGLVSPDAPGQDEVVYDIRVQNPNENQGTLSGALTIVPPPELLSIDPDAAEDDEIVEFTLTGTGFRDGMTVTLDANPAVEADNIVVVSSTEATGEFDLTGVLPGVYDVTLTNADGCSFTLEDAFTVFADEFDIVGIDPPFGCRCEDTTVTITSTGGFASTPQVEMRPAGRSEPVVELKNEAFIDENTITAVVPADLDRDLGLYDVLVVNPPSNGGFAFLADAFTVVELPVPEIEAIVPSRGSPQENTDVTIFGENFRAPVTVELIDGENNIDASVPDVMAVNNNGTEIAVTLPTTGMDQDAYLVRVTNQDEGTFSTFSSFLVAETGPDGNLATFSNETTLNTGRRILAGATAKDTSGSTFFYAIGGDTGDPNDGGTVLDSVEVSQLSKFGELSDWSDIKNTMVTPRVGATAVAVPLFDTDVSRFTPIKTFIYVLGGLDDQGNVLQSIERAVVLSPDDAPVVEIAPSADSGNLDPGTWYYKVSAVLDANDPDNPGGETLPSDEAIITISSGTTAIDLSWDPVTVNGLEAVSYNIYRTDAVDGVSQTEHLIASGITATSFTDTGEAAGTESPLPPGATGVWQTDDVSLVTARWGHQAAIVTDPATGDRFIYALGGKPDTGNGYLASVEVSIVNNADGSIGTFDDTNTTPLPTARAFFSLAVETPQNVADFGDIARFYAIGGVVATVTNGTQSTTLVDFSDVTGGDTPGNTAWLDYAGNCGDDDCAGDLLTRGGPMAVITSEKLFVLGGAGLVQNDLDFGTIRSDGRDADFDPEGDNGIIGGPIQSTAEALEGPRALGVSLIGSGFIYFIGGTSDGADALATTEKTF